MKEREAVVAEEYFTLRSIGDVTQCGDLGLDPGFTVYNGSLGWGTNFKESQIRVDQSLSDAW